MPELWWHQVTTAEPGVMLNWFWETYPMRRDRQRFPDAESALLSNDLGRALDVCASFEVALHRGALRAAVAARALDAGADSEARAILASIASRAFRDSLRELFDP